MPSKYGFGDSRSKNAPVYKKSSGFKMKGSPMQRNFGIVSPNKQKKDDAPDIGETGGQQESNIGLSSYSPQSVEKTLLSNEFANKQPEAEKGKSPNKQGAAVTNPNITKTGKELGLSGGIVGTSASAAKFPWAAVISGAISLYQGYKNRKLQKEMLAEDKKRYENELARVNREKEKSKTPKTYKSPKTKDTTPPWTRNVGTPS